MDIGICQRAVCQSLMHDPETATAQFRDGYFGDVFNRVGNTELFCPLVQAERDFGSARGILPTNRTALSVS
jgi:hypothetical protein